MHRFILALGLVGCVSAPAPVSHPAEVIPCVWELRSPTSMGSGTAVSCVKEGDRYRVVVLTAHHVLRYHDKLPGWEMLARNGGVILTGGKVLAIHPALDAALIVFTADHPVLTARLGGAVEPLDELYAAGYSGGRGQLWISNGVASAPDRASTPVAPGDSGGPVFDGAGRVVGVISNIDAMRSGNLVFHHLRFVPVAAMAEWLASHL